MEKKDLKYMRWLTSTYTDMLCGVLHDIDSYHGFYLTTQIKKSSYFMGCNKNLKKDIEDTISLYQS